MPTPEDGRTSRELLQALTAEGRSLTNIATHLGRSTRMLRYVLRGEKPGTNLTPALTELLTTGQVTTQPARRTTKAGTPAKVRGRGGTAVTPRQPRKRAAPPAKKAPAKKAAKRRPAKKAPTRKRPPQAKTRSGAQPEFVRSKTPAGRNRLDVRHTRFPGGRTKTDIRVPRRGWNREQGNETIYEAVNAGVDEGQRLQITTWVELDAEHDHRRMPVTLGGKGGYDSEDFARAIRIEQLDALSLLEAQISERYAEFETGEWNIIQVELDFW